VAICHKRTFLENVELHSFIHSWPFLQISFQNPNQQKQTELKDGWKSATLPLLRKFMGIDFIVQGV